MFCIFVEFADFVFGQFAYHMRRSAHNQTAFRKFLVLRDNGTGSNYTVRLDMHAVHKDCTHANQHVIVYIAGMQNGIVANGYIVAHMYANSSRKMDCYIVLNIGTFADSNFGKVCTNDSVIEHRRIISDFDIANDFCTIGDKNAFAQDRTFTFVFN